jgi:hypothetical protein
VITWGDLCDPTRAILAAGGVPPIRATDGEEGR